jgi:hypothetical protein
MESSFNSRQRSKDICGASGKGGEDVFYTSIFEKLEQGTCYMKDLIEAVPNKLLPLSGNFFTLVAMRSKGIAPFTF